MRLIILLTLIMIAAVACQGPPPTQYVLVVTATPFIEVQSVEEVTPSDTPPEVTSAPTAEPTSTVSPLPPPIIKDVYVAEQPFQNGTMFWLQDTEQIWVMATDDSGKQVWAIYDDRFTDGELELDPNIEEEVPEGFIQPRRGFGKLWRENPEIREALGWGLDIELGHTTRYEYHPGGTINEDNEYVPGPGVHRLTSIFGNTYQFNEGSWTWQLAE